MQMATDEDESSTADAARSHVTMLRPLARREFRPLYRLDADAVRSARGASKLGLSEFAARAGWSRQWQAKLEDGDSLVPPATYETLTRVLRECGVRLAEFVESSP